MMGPGTAALYYTTSIGGWSGTRKKKPIEFTDWYTHWNPAVFSSQLHQVLSISSISTKQTSIKQQLRWTRHKFQVVYNTNSDPQREMVISNISPSLKALKHPWSDWIRFHISFTVTFSSQCLFRCDPVWSLWGPVKSDSLRKAGWTTQFRK